MSRNQNTQRNNHSNKRHKKNRNRKQRDSRMVITLGANEPQSFPFTTGKRVVPKCIRFAATRVTSNGVGEFLHRISMRNPTRAINGSGTYEDVAGLSNIYDTYKPIRLRVKLVPCFATAAFGVGSVVAAPDYEDLDQSQVVTTVSAANQYEERQVIDPRFMSEIIFKIPRLESGSIPGLTSTAPAVIQAGGFLDFNAPPYDGVVYLVGAGFPLNMAVFDIYLEMDILLRFSR